VDVFIFTDSDRSFDDGVHKVSQDHLGWPFSTLYKFHLFDRIKHRLVNYDACVYFNANIEFLTPIDHNSFFGRPGQLLACQHPGFWDKSVESFTYERRKTSLAYLATGTRYYAGGLMGGTTWSFLEAIQTMKGQIDTDLRNGIVTVWHDESYWNAYLNQFLDYPDTKVHVLHPGYLYPEGWIIPFEKKINLLEKSRFMNVRALKGQPQEMQQSSYRFLRRLYTWFKSHYR